MLASTTNSSEKRSVAESNFMEACVPAMAWAYGRENTLISSMFQAAVVFHGVLDFQLENAKMSQNVQLWRCWSARSITASISTVLAARGDDAVGQRLPHSVIIDGTFSFLRSDATALNTSGPRCLSQNLLVQAWEGCVWL